MAARFVLASASPRRRELLAAVGATFDVRPADIDEDGVAAGFSPEDGVLAVARAKAAACAERAVPVLAGDTIVVLDGVVLGKPADDAASRAMLHALSGRTHRVYTAVCAREAGGEHAVLVESVVNMRALPAAEIDAYVASGQGRDKAGSYGIQDDGFAPVTSIEGCYCNVMGLPLWTACHLLGRVGALPPMSPRAAFARCAVCPHARDD
jgi:septum formation protein